MSDHDVPDDDNAFDEDAPVAFPKTVLTAGIMWICFGVLGIVAYFVSSILVAVAGAAAPPPGGKVEPSGGHCCGVLFSIAFIYVGIRSVQGKAKDTMGNSIGSIVFSLIYFALGIALLSLGQTVEAIVLCCICVSLGAGLLVAGILALVGRKQYKLWRREQKREMELRRRQESRRRRNDANDADEEDDED